LYLFRPERGSWEAAGGRECREEVADDGIQGAEEAACGEL
jgi:hypothetical protein